MIHTSVPLARKTSTKWLFPVLLGFFLPLVAFGLYFLLNPPVDAATAQTATKLGADPRQYGDVLKLLKSTEQTHTIDAGGWNRLVSYYQGGNPIIQRESISVMMMLNHSPYHAQIITLIHPLLTGTKANMAEAALILLWRWNEPGWHEEALRLKSDTAHPELAATATDLLERQHLSK